MSWGQPEEVTTQPSGWGSTEPQAQSAWGNSDQQSNAWGGNEGSNNEQKQEGQRGGRGGRGRGRGEFRGRGGGRGRGRGGHDRGEERDKPDRQEQSQGQQGGGWGQSQPTEKPSGNTEGGWGGETTTTAGWGENKTEGQGWGNSETTNTGVEEGEVKGKGRKSDSPPPAKRVRPNPIVIVVEDDGDSDTQNIIIQEHPVLQEKQKGLVIKEESQVCYEGNVKVEDCMIGAKFISFDTSLPAKIEGLDAYTFENAKEHLKKIGDNVVVGIVEGVDAENQKALNKLADNLLDKQQAIYFQERNVNLFSVKQLYKLETKSRLAFVMQI